MKKWSLLFAVLLTVPFLWFLSWFALTSGEHHYERSDIFSYWLYTPDALKNVPLISEDVEYNYEYNLDNQQTRVIVKWDHINDIAAKKACLIVFLQQLNPSMKYNCIWIYHDLHNYADNYQRYCISQKWDSLELEYFETVK